MECHDLQTDLDRLWRDMSVSERDDFWDVMIEELYEPHLGTVKPDKRTLEMLGRTPVKVIYSREEGRLHDLIWATLKDISVEWWNKMAVTFLDYGGGDLKNQRKTLENLYMLQKLKAQRDQPNV